MKLVKRKVWPLIEFPGELAIKVGLEFPEKEIGWLTAESDARDLAHHLNKNWNATKFKVGEPVEIMLDDR